MDDIHENIAEYNPNKECKRLIIFDNINDMLFNKKFQQSITELFIGGRKLNISLVSIAQFYFAGPKNIGLHNILLREFPTYESFNKFQLIIH